MLNKIANIELIFNRILHYLQCNSDLRSIGQLYPIQVCYFMRQHVNFLSRTRLETLKVQYDQFILNLLDKIPSQQALYIQKCDECLEWVDLNDYRYSSRNNDKPPPPFVGCEECYYSTCSCECFEGVICNDCYDYGLCLKCLDGNIPSSLTCKNCTNSLS